MSERNERANDPWTQLGEELGEYLLQSFRAEMNNDIAGSGDSAVETLAAHAHDEIWAGWMSYLFSKGHENDDGSFTIPASWYWRWKYQAQTPYTQLPEDMKESDREEARRILRLLEGSGE